MGQTPTVRWLLEYGGAKIAERGELGWSALLCAVGKLGTMEFLLTEGEASILERNYQGQCSYYSRYSH
jgi:hypothetical protein